MLAEALAGMFAATTFDGANPRDPAIARLLGLGSKTESGVQVTPDTVLGYPAMWRAVNILCNGVAKPKLHTYRRRGIDREPATDHAAYRLLAHHANPYCGAARLRKLLLHHALFWGNGLAWIKRDESGQPIEMWLLPPDKTVMVRSNGETQSEDLNGSDMPLMYITEFEGRKFGIEPSDVFHIRGLGYDQYWGYPVVEVLADAIGVGMAAQRYGGRFFGRGATPGAVIMAPPGMKDDQMEDYARAIKKNIEGIGNAHRALVVGNGTEVKPLSVPPEHAQFLQTREFEVRVVSNVAGVQPHKLGDPTRKSFNSLEQSNQEHLDDDLDPWFGVFEEEAEDKLLTKAEQEADSHFVEFDREALARTNLAAQTAHFASGRQWGYYSANDIRRKRNLPPIPYGDVYLTPANMAPANAPAPDPGESDREMTAELIRSEVERFAKRIAKGAMTAAKRGDKQFLAFLDKIPETAREPECIADRLGVAAAFMRSKLTAYTEPPWTIETWQAGVEQQAESLAAEAIEVTLATGEKHAA